MGEDGPHRHQDRDPLDAQGRHRPAPHPGALLRRAVRRRTAHGHGARRRPAAGDRTAGGLRTPRASFPTASGAGCVQGLIFTACFSRHQFVWPTFSQTTEEVIRGFEAAWGYFGAVFPVVIPDNMKSIVITADNIAPRFNDVFIEYAQSRGFVIDAARVATPTDKPRVERVVNYVQQNFFAGEVFFDLADCRARAETWCTETAGMRIHGTTQCRPIEFFRTEEQPCCCPGPTAPSTHPSGPTPRCTGTSTSRWARPSTRCPTSWSAGSCGPGPTRPR